MAKRSEAAAERRARAKELQDQHRRAERRRTFLVVGSCVAVGVVIVAVAVVALVNQQRQQSALEGAAAGSIKGVAQFDGLSRNHVTNRVDYPQTPSVGGNHAGVWTNCGVYTTAVDPMQATHSLEHGAVWIGYQPGLDDAQVQTLTDLAKGNDFVLLSPVSGVPSPITISAWGRQLQVDSADDPRIPVFLKKYQVGEQTPEPGAPCTGGVNS